MTSTLSAVQVTGWQARISWLPDPDDEGIGAAETVSLTRVVDGIEHPVMGAQSVPNLPDVWDDPEIPLGRPVVYRMTGGPGSTSIGRRNLMIYPRTTATQWVAAGSFPQGVGWGPDSKTVMSRPEDTSAPSGGRYITRLTIPGAGTTRRGEVFWTGDSALPIVKPGSPCTSSLWVRSSAPVSVYAHARTTIQGGSSYVQRVDGQVVTLAPNKWTRISVSLTVDPTAEKIRIFAYLDGAVSYPANTTLDLDACLIEQSDVLGDYFDGAKAGAEWTGDPDASESVLVVQGASIDAAPVTVAGPPIPGMGGAPGAVLSDPLRAMSVPVIVLEEHLPTSRKTRASAIDVEGQAQRVVITHVEAAATRQPQWLTETVAQAGVVDDLLSPGTAVLLRASCDIVRDEWLQPLGDRSVEPVTGTSQTRKHSLGETQILAANPAIGERATGDTLGDLDQLIDATLEDISTYPEWSTLGDIAATDIRGLLS